MDLSCKLRRNPAVVHRELSGDRGAVLLHLETGQYHGLNTTGSLIWSLIDDGSTPAEVTDRLSERLDDPDADVADDVVSFLDSLRERGLVLG